VISDIVALLVTVWPSFSVATEHIALNVTYHT